MKKILLAVASAVVVAVLGFFLAKNWLAEAVMENGVKALTGMPLDLGKIDVSLLKTFVDIRDLRLFNPPGYRDKVMVNMPELYVDYNLPAFLTGKVHLESLRVDLKELTVIKNEKGQVNIDSLKTIQQQQKQKAEKAPPPPEAKKPKIQIDVFKLKIGRVVFKDYSKGAEPYVKGFDIYIDDTYTNITDPNYLVSLILLKALQKTTISSLTSFSLDDLKSSLPYTMTSPTQIATAAGTKAQEMLGGAPEQAGSVVSGAASALSGLFGGDDSST